MQQTEPLRRFRHTQAHASRTSPLSAVTASSQTDGPGRHEDRHVSDVYPSMSRSYSGLLKRITLTFAARTQAEAEVSATKIRYIPVEKTLS